MKLRPHETVLKGSWINVNNVMHGDAVCERIDWLIKNELREMASSPKWGDWETLFQDPSDGRYWERTYPYGDLQGGGPPQLEVISEDKARAKYNRA
jgi:hypothetical protein